MDIKEIVRRYRESKSEISIKESLQFKIDKYDNDIVFNCFAYYYVEVLTKRFDIKEDITLTKKYKKYLKNPCIDIYETLKILFDKTFSSGRKELLIFSNIPNTKAFIVHYNPDKNFMYAFEEGERISDLMSDETIGRGDRKKYVFFVFAE